MRIASFLVIFGVFLVKFGELCHPATDSRRFLRDSSTNRPTTTTPTSEDTTTTTTEASSADVTASRSSRTQESHESLENQGKITAIQDDSGEDPIYNKEEVEGGRKDAIQNKLGKNGPQEALTKDTSGENPDESGESIEVTDETVKRSEEGANIKGNPETKKSSEEASGISKNFEEDSGTSKSSKEGSETSGSPDESPGTNKPSRKPSGTSNNSNEDSTSSEESPYIPDPLAKCPSPTWTLFHRHRYSWCMLPVLDPLLTPLTALTTCQEQGNPLAVPTGFQNIQEIARIIPILAKQANYAPKNMIIGAEQQENGGKFGWTDGVTRGDEGWNWGKGRPRGQRYVIIDGYGTFDDVDGEKVQDGVICGVKASRDF